MVKLVQMLVAGIIEKWLQHLVVVMTKFVHWLVYQKKAAINIRMVMVMTLLSRLIKLPRQRWLDLKMNTEIWMPMTKKHLWVNFILI